MAAEFGKQHGLDAAIAGREIAGAGHLDAAEGGAVIAVDQRQHLRGNLHSYG